MRIEKVVDEYQDTMTARGKLPVDIGSLHDWANVLLFDVPRLLDAVRASGRVAEAWLDAGTISPSLVRYRVTWPHAHKTLRAGDVVVMTKSPLYENMLLREPDMTLHRLVDENGQHVHLVALVN